MEPTTYDLYFRNDAEAAAAVEASIYKENSYQGEVFRREVAEALADLISREQAAYSQ
ncbi:hypothetical protein [Vibrio harveyi]|uniref:hypothetical protein n=1 Tax=Vibrio harveyi TaxID=669 RepID=UPI00165D9246|nr:hypothetical protein [Vibrio harveyi]